MIRTGLVSVTFRTLTVEEVIRNVKCAGLDGIEWGGDIHVPHGDVKRANEVQQATYEAGLSVAAYGSYYCIGVSEASGLPFSSVLASAVALGAPVIRVWAGDRGSSNADDNYRRMIAKDALRITALAASKEVSIAYEWHENTLTDVLDSSLKLLKDAVHPCLRTYWQKDPGIEHADCLVELSKIQDRLDNIHVDYTLCNERKPLSYGMGAWREYLEAANVDGKTRYALLEFVCEDSPKAFMEDAAILKNIVSSL